MVNRHFILFALAFASACSGFAKTFDVDISTGRPAASNEAYYHGETIEFRAVRGRSVVTNVEYGCIYYQTNGMEQAWWHTDGLVFHPTNDVGAASYRFFLEGRDDLGRDWHANGALRLLDSPGYTPNTIELPVARLDFAAVDVLNPPWIDPDYSTNNTALVATIEATSPAPGDYATVSNRAMTALQSYAETDPTVPAWAKAETQPLPPNYSTISNKAMTALQEHQSLANYYNKTETEAKIVELAPAPGDYANVSNRAMTALQSYTESDPTIKSWAKANTKPTYTASEVGAATASSVSTLSSQVTSIGAHLNAEDARFVSTNYNSDVHMPEASAEVNISNEWLVIWREMTRWNAFTGPGFDWSAWCGFGCFRTNLLAELDQKADRAWGFYDSHTGLYAPEGYTQISSSNVLIAAGMGYQRTITAEGTYWVLTANEPYATYGISSNGFFRVEDADGNVQFEIVKGDKRTVPAPAGGVTVGSGSPHPLTISYPVESQPTLEVALSLSYPSSWHAEADASCPAVVTWTGSSGAYVATVTPAAPAAQLFVRATYQVGGSTYINNRAPVSLSGGIIYNGTVYMPTVSGNELKFIAQ